jgi:anti-repressor protein
MENKLQVFKNNEFGEIRALQINNEPWFVGKDLAKCLGYSNTRDAIDKHIDKEDKGVAKLDTPGGKQNMVIVNESGLYSLILGSQLPTAKRFKRWVTKEVLPSIRKHGAYLTDNVMDEILDNPDFGIRLLEELKAERSEKQLLQSQIEEDRPKVVFAEALEISETSILVGELAKILRQNGIDIGQNRLFKWLRNNGYLGRRGENYNIPTQYSMDLGLFEIKVRTINNPDGSTRTTKTPKVTGKGQIYFINKFKKYNTEKAM